MALAPVPAWPTVALHIMWVQEEQGQLVVLQAVQDPTTSPSSLPSQVEFGLKAKEVISQLDSHFLFVLDLSSWLSSQWHWNRRNRPLRSWSSSF
eukprot:241079-Pyramimonas_sp.AAC.1